MEKKGTLTRTQRLILEEKITTLSELEEAYVLGFIEGAKFNEEKQSMGHAENRQPERRKTRRN